MSQDNSCRYCFAAQRAILRVLGFTEERITRLEHDLMLDDLAPPVKAALDFARRISRSNPLCGKDDVERLRAAGFDDDSIREIARQDAATWGGSAAPVPLGLLVGAPQFRRNAACDSNAEIVFAVRSDEFHSTSMGHERPLPATCVAIRMP